MSAASDEALKLLAAGRLDDAHNLALQGVKRDPDDAQANYALGQCLRFRNKYSAAREALTRAHDLEPGQTHILLALAVACQLDGAHHHAVSAIKDLLAIDPDHVLAFNTLAMTQKLMGAYEKAAHNYDQGAQALARANVRMMENSESSPRLTHWDSRNSLWARYATLGATYVGAVADVDEVCFPTDAMAARDAQTGEFRGWYWKEERADGKRALVFLPNFFNTFCARLRADSLYATMMGNRSTVLRLMGDDNEADRHVQEAEDFSA